MKIKRRFHIEWRYTLLNALNLAEMAKKIVMDEYATTDNTTTINNTNNNNKGRKMGEK